MDNKSNNGSLLTKTNGLKQSLLIPENTLSLLWISDDLYQNPYVENLNPETGEVTWQIDKSLSSDVYAEPSLIWTQLPVEPNDLNLPDKPYYYPKYSGLTPVGRFQYLYWLRDITEQTWMSFVYLYYYGLERHLLLGDYDSAIDEIKILLQHHDIGIYVYNSLAVASLYKNKDIYKNFPDIDTKMTVPLLIRYHNKSSLTPEIVLYYSKQSGFRNNRYINQKPELFGEELQKAIDKLEQKMSGSFFSKFQFTEFIDYRFIINESLAEYVKNIKVPNTKEYEFEKLIYFLLEEAHDNVTFRISPNTKILKSDKPIQNSYYKELSTKNLDEAIEKLAKQYTPSNNIPEDQTDLMSSKQFKYSLEQLYKNDALASVNPDMAIQSANELLDSGYRAPAAFESLAGAYLRKNEYKSALDVLMQARIDYGYNYYHFLRTLLGRFRSELEAPREPSQQIIILDEKIAELLSNKDESKWAGEDKSTELSLKERNKFDEKLKKIWRLRKNNPEKSLDQSLALFKEGYRSEYVCRCIAASYRELEQYDKEVDFLIQVKKDFKYYNFDATLRQAIRLLGK